MSERYPDIEIRFKNGVPADGLQAVIWKAVYWTAMLYGSIGIEHLTITSTTDGAHKTGSLHYSGRAVDIRTWHVPDVEKLAASLRVILGRHYDVVVETDHLHIEYDPAP
jgi:hypothetical protein